MRLPAPPSELAAVLVHLAGYEELGVLGPSVRGLRRLDLVLAQRLAVGLERVVLVGRAEPDVGTHAYEGGALVVIGRGLQRAGDLLDVVAVVDVERAPPVGGEAGGDVFRE